MSTLPQALSVLANYRTTNTRASRDIFDKGALLLKSNATASLGDDAWIFLEQLALAAIDIGRLDVADECLEQLTTKFPGSTRVDVLAGIRIEADQPAETAIQYYDQLLEEDPTNGAAWKRQISIRRRTGSLERAVTELNQYLDTFYNDVEGWLELADIYAQCNQYTFSLRALSHLLLLNPQNPFYALKYAETAYTSADVPLALKMFLVVIDLCESDSPDVSNSPTGVTTRAWYGVKLCTRRLIATPDIPSASRTPIVKNLNKVDELATERILQAYASGNPSKQVVRDWLSATY